MKSLTTSASDAEIRQVAEGALWVIEDKQHIKSIQGTSSKSQQKSRYSVYLESDQCHINFITARIQVEVYCPAVTL